MHGITPKGKNHMNSNLIDQRFVNLLRIGETAEEFLKNLHLVKANKDAA